jgi:YD repeat-containing protein
MPVPEPLAGIDVDHRLADYETDPTGSIATTVYDAASNVTNVIDQLNHKTTYVYDALEPAKARTGAACHGRHGPVREGRIALGFLASDE